MAMLLIRRLLFLGRILDYLLKKYLLVWRKFALVHFPDMLRLERGVFPVWVAVADVSAEVHGVAGLVAKRGVATVLILETPLLLVEHPGAQAFLK
jgi:hypothetical protein